MLNYIEKCKKVLILIYYKYTDCVSLNIIFNCKLLKIMAQFLLDTKKL